jgi:hypothetical protein
VDETVLLLGIVSFGAWAYRRRLGVRPQHKDSIWSVRLGRCETGAA